MFLFFNIWYLSLVRYCWRPLVVVSCTKKYLDILNRYWYLFLVLEYKQFIIRSKQIKNEFAALYGHTIFTTVKFKPFKLSKVVLENRRVKEVVKIMKMRKHSEFVQTGPTMSSLAID